MPLQASQYSSAAKNTPELPLKLPPKFTDPLLQDLSWQPSSNVPAPKSLKALAREGIPAELRPTLWFQLSGGLALKKAAPPSYYRSLTRLGSKEAKLGGISSSDADMFRTFRQALCCIFVPYIQAARPVCAAAAKRTHLKHLHGGKIEGQSQQAATSACQVPGAAG